MEMDSCTPDVSVVIPCRNSFDTIKKTLLSLQNQSTQPCEIIIVDDGSVNPLINPVPEYSVEITRLEQSRGPAYARNHGARLARGDIILFLDADVIAETGLVQTVIDSYLSDPGISAVQGIYDPVCSDTHPASLYQNFYYHHAYTAISPGDVAICSTFCFAIRRTDFLETGGFDDQIPKPTVEDEVFGYILTSKGYRISLNHGAMVRHMAEYTYTSLISRKFRMSFNQIKSTLRGTIPPVLNGNRTHHSRRVLAALLIAPFLPVLGIIHLPAGLGLLLVYCLLNSPFWLYLRKYVPVQKIPGYMILTWIDHCTITMGLITGAFHFTVGYRY
jgi:glycosyltransferase involved in cell wall biosynthesis